VTNDLPDHRERVRSWHLSCRLGFKPGTVPFNAAAIDLTALFGLDRLSSKRRLVCHWARDTDGRLSCHWEPDIVPIPQR
jgi:hypothetical protein